MDRTDTSHQTGDFFEYRSVSMGDQERLHLSAFWRIIMLNSHHVELMFVERRQFRVYF
jgi:hypothetical protein